MGGQVARQTASIRPLPRACIHLEPKLGQHHRELVHRGTRQGLEAVVVQVVLQVVAVVGAVLVVVQFEDDFVGFASREVVDAELAGPRSQGGTPDDGRQKGVEGQTGQEDEKVRVGGVHGFGALLHVRVPGLPVVGRFGGARGGLAWFVAEADGHEGGPVLALKLGWC